MTKSYAVILLSSGFGGAEKRFTQLLEYLQKQEEGSIYFIVTYDLYKRIKNLFPDYPITNIIPIGSESSLIQQNSYLKIKNSKEPEELTYKSHHPFFPKQVYRYFKNYYYQRRLYKEIEKIRKEKQIKVFIGVYSGIIPLYFYLQQKKRDTGIIFCDMDSWFRDIYPKEKKYWYRKYASFNMALERSDYVDFLSPFILQGVRERGIEVRDEAISITPCSFAEYSKCFVGKKEKFEVAFAARLEKDKNPMVYLEAAKKLSQKYPDIIFHIMGKGRYSQKVLEFVNNNLPNIVYHGFHINPPQVLAETSVFVSIQTTNNYPSQSVLEAMACGNAIVATDVGDTRMFVNENNGILINLDVDELSAAIEKLYLNRAFCKQLGSFSEKYVKQNHTIERSAEYYLELFEKAYRKVNHK